MKIAYIHDVIYPYVKGGAEKRVWEVAKRLVDRGHEVHIFGMKYWRGDDVILKDGVYLHGVCDPKELYVDGRRSIKTSIYFSFKLLCSFNGDFDVIDSQEFPYFPCFSAKIRSYLKGTPLVITWHEVWDDYWNDYLGRWGLFGRWIETLTTKIPDKIISVSERVNSDLLSIGVSKSKILVVPNGVDFHQIQKIESTGVMEHNESYDVLYVGRLIKHKNVDLLLKAISMIKSDGLPIKCGIIGDGPEKDELVKLTKDLNLDNHVDFLGFVERDEDVIAKMKSSKIFVLPSEREGFGMVLIEANACGLPVITVDAPKNAGANLVNEGENGIVCTLSAECMAVSISNLLKDDSYKKLTESSIKYAKKYDWSAIVTQMERAYGEVSK